MNSLKDFQGRLSVIKQTKDGKYWIDLEAEKNRIKYTILFVIIFVPLLMILFLICFFLFRKLADIAAAGFIAFMEQLFGN